MAKKTKTAAPVIEDMSNTAIGHGAARQVSKEQLGVCNCTVIGRDVPIPEEDGTVRIGTGDRYLEITADGKARIVGAEGDEAVAVVLAGLETASESLDFMFRRFSHRRDDR